MDNTTKIIISLLGAGGILWYFIGIGYTYPLLGDSNYFGTNFATYSSRFFKILGETLLCCIAILIGLILLSIQWESIDTIALLCIIMATVALALTTSAMAVASITH
jgi:hypothetical protein